jgi:hypothetical protein
MTTPRLAAARRPGKAQLASAPGEQSLPNIDWQRRYFAADEQLPAKPTTAADWRRDFVTHLGKNDGQRQPNASLRVQVEVSPPRWASGRNHSNEP